MPHGDHKHHHHPKNGSTKNIRFAFFLNLSFAIFELIGGLWTNSIAVLTDALHDLGDSMALGFAWYLEKKSHQKSDERFSYGYRRFSVLSAVLTGGVLVFGALFILMEAIPRLIEPQMPRAGEMVLLALVGVTVNGIAAWRVSHGHSLNERMITWHLLEDVLGWVLVLVGGLIMYVWPLPMIDAILAVMLALWVLYNAFKNLKSATKVFLQAVPEGLNVSTISDSIIQKNSEVVAMHHLHLWSIDGEKHVLTAHMVVQDGLSALDLSELKARVKRILHSDFGIDEATLEVEWKSEECRDPKHTD